MQTENVYTLSMSKTQSARLEIINAQMLLARYDTVESLIRYWKTSGPTPGPSIERVEEGWTSGLF